MSHVTFLPYIYLDHFGSVFSTTLAMLVGRFICSRVHSGMSGMVKQAVDVIISSFLGKKEKRKCGAIFACGR
jgi:hypothetical protein